MKWYTDKKRVDKSFGVGDWVYLRLQPYKQVSVHLKKIGKLVPRFYGPFQVFQKLGEVSYKLEFLEGLLVHLVFLYLISRLNWDNMWSLDLPYQL